ncbi:MAG: class I SAM-dependent methyltransferase [Actinobacteria bacterium]|nr:class I SAM-dependent methyltransferase [Actinomycetota bacterium]
MGQDDTTSHARRYWDERAGENALWYVDTSLDYDAPDVERFLADGDRVVTYALDRHEHLLPGHDRALEIGCGVGRICRALADRFDTVIGVDISPRMIERARELVPDDRVRFIVGDGASLGPVEDASVDVVLSYTVFQHIPDPTIVAAYIREAARVLRPGGLLVVQWNGQPRARWWALQRRARVLAARLGLGSQAARSREAAPFIGARVPVDRMRAVVTDAGLEVREVANAGTLFSWMWAQQPPAPALGAADRGTG